MLELPRHIRHSCKKKKKRVHKLIQFNNMQLIKNDLDTVSLKSEEAIPYGTHEYHFFFLPVKWESTSFMDTKKFSKMVPGCVSFEKQM